MMFFPPPFGLVNGHSQRSKTALAASRKAIDFFDECVAKPDAKFLLYHSKRQLVARDATNATIIAWQSLAVIRRLGLVLEEERSAVVGAARAVVLAESESRESSIEAPSIAVDVSHVEEALVIEACGSVSFAGTRDLMVTALPSSAMDAGRALAVLSWHAANLYCGACGAKTASREGGAKRACVTCGKRFYPRLDPVAIALVYRRDDHRVLLGRSNKFRPGMYSCLSGFVEPVETVEAAIRREVNEESGVLVDTVHILSSQPWPVGRAGACELMIGCFAEVSQDWIHDKDSKIIVDKSELEDVRWFTRDELKDAFDCAIKYANAGSQPPNPDTIWIPGHYAIAHHLVKRYLEHGPLPAAAAPPAKEELLQSTSST